MPCLPGLSFYAHAYFCFLKVSHFLSRFHPRFLLLPKVRCLWTQITETLTRLQKEIEVVDSVVKGHIDQYILDGTSVAINVPRPLLEKVEKDMHQVSFFASLFLRHCFCRIVFFFLSAVVSFSCLKFIVP